MGYTNCLFVSTMKNLDLFDNISYKYIKDIINDDDDEIDVEIEDLPCDRIAYCKTQFKFSIPQLIDERFGEKYYKDATFNVVKEYNGSSPFAYMMLELDEESEESEESSDGDCEVCKDDDDDDDDWKYLCPNNHWGGQYGCDLCLDGENVKDKDNGNMEKAWLNKSNKYCYKLHKKWLGDK